MPDNAATNSDTVRPRTKSTPEGLPTDPHRKPVRRHTSANTTDSITPLINIEEETARDPDTDEKTPVPIVDSTALEGDNKESVLYADEENDTLTLLTDVVPLSPTGTGSRHKGILKRCSVVESGSFSGSPTSINSPQLSSQSHSVVSRGGWRRESKVRFKPPPRTEDTIGKSIVH